MDQASPDLLLMIFRNLNSKEMVSVMRVERKWLQIIDEHKTLWRELVLPPRRSFNGWGLQVLELFDRKSNSTLKRVSMILGSGVESGLFVETLERSKDTLRVLDIKMYMNYRVEKALIENLGRFPNLVECRLTSASTRYYILSLQLGEGDEDEEDNKGSSLRVLWIDDYSEKLFKSQLYILDNLVSLVLLDGRQGFVEMRRIFKRPSRTLKHLRIAFNEDEEIEVPSLSFPNLQFLEIDLMDYSASVFPSWMRLPSLSTLVIWNSQTLSSLPACSNLWLVDLREFENLSELAFQCPGLVELRMDLSDVAKYEMPIGERVEILSSMLSQRKANVEAGVKIEGVKMISLKTLVIPFNVVESKAENGLVDLGLSKLRELVEEVIDLREKISESSELIEMEV